MKLVMVFLSSIVAAACTSNPPRAWQPVPVESARADAYTVRSQPAAAPLGVAALEPAASRTPLAAQDHAPDGSHAARIMLLFGMRFLDEDDYEPVEDQPVFGIDFSYEPHESLIGFEVGLMGSYEEDEILGADLEVGIGEIYGGVRKTFGGLGVRPYVGAGLAAINVDVKIEGAGSDDDTSLAGYVHGGVLAQLGSSFFVGVDGRALFASDIEIAGISGDADYAQLAIVLGWGF